MDSTTDHWIEYDELGKRMRSRRVELGLTQERLGEMADISSSFVGHIERAEKIPSVETLVRLCACLRVSMDYLVMGKKQVCDKESCSLFEDLQGILAVYSSSQDALKG